MADLIGKRALVTGATGGIGDAIARRLHEAGAKLAISGTRVHRLEALAKDLDGEVCALPCDLTDGNAVKDLCNRATKAIGGVDILINNAGVTRDSLLLRMSDEDWRTVLDVNLSSVMILSKSAMRGMLRSRWGRIVNISSVVGVTGNPGQANYAASKAGMIGFTKSLAAEVAIRGITVNTVAPGFIETDMTGKLSDSRQQQILAQIPAGRMGTPDEVADAVVYLSSDRSSYITGQTLHVNGGMAMI